MHSYPRQLFIICAALLLMPGLLPGQHTKIEQAYEEGVLSLDQKILYQFLAGVPSSTLPESYRESNAGPIKCGTPALMEYHRHRSELSPSTVTQMESMLRARDTQALETYRSASGRFQINYNTSGEHAIPLQDANNNGTPDYVEWVAQAADSSYRHEVQTLGYSDPVPDPNNPYQIYFEDIDFYGYTATENGTTYIVLHNNYENFPNNDDPDSNQRGAIRVTAAHELKHAIQYVATGWSGETDQWTEMDATLMEEVVYDEVNDYYNYLADPESIFSDPGASFYPGSYYHVSWALFFEEKYGPQFWSSVWETIRSNPEIAMVDALNVHLVGSAGFLEAYTESQLWHYASGSYAVDDFGFEEGENYPDPPVAGGDNFYTDDLATPQAPTGQMLDSFSATYYAISPPSSANGNVAAEISVRAQHSGIGLLARFSDGSTDTRIVASSEEQTTAIDTDWLWSDISSLALVLTNADTEESLETATVQVGSGEFDQLTLNQNYPNPFRQTTTIRFTLEESSHVNLDIFDSIGRRVRTLYDQELDPGLYVKTFDGSDLASGVYIYQLVTDQQTIAKKMMLIK